MPANNNKGLVANLERDERILELSLLKNSQRHVAEMVGCSQSTVRNVLKKAREERLHPKADQYRNEQIDRLHLYLKVLTTKILAGDEKALQSALRTEERIARLLGLDSATAFTIDTRVTREGDRLEVDKLIAKYFDKGKE